MKRILKILSINISIFIGILLLLNLSAIVVYNGYKLYKSTQDTVIYDKQHLPNYENTKWAAQHFEEFSQLPTEYQSYIGWRRSPFQGKTININDIGIRYSKQNENVTADTPLVAFLGGSTMWGSGSNDISTIPSFFSKISNSKYRAINLGESGYTALQSNIFLNLQLMDKLKPSIVVSYDGVNDSSNLKIGFTGHKHFRENQISALLKEKNAQKDDPRLSFSYYLFGPLEIFFLKIKNRFLGVKPQIQYDLSSENVAVMAKELLESWRQTKKLSEAHGAIFIAILQPNAGIGEPNLSHLQLDLSTLKAYRVGYKKIQELLRTEEYQDLSHNVTILTDAFNNDDYIYIDDCHVSPNGNKIIAHRILDIIKKTINQ